MQKRKREQKSGQLFTFSINFIFNKDQTKFDITYLYHFQMFLCDRNFDTNFVNFVIFL